MELDHELFEVLIQSSSQSGSSSRVNPNAMRSAISSQDSSSLALSATIHQRTPSSQYLVKSDASFNVSEDFGAAALALQPKADGDPSVPDAAKVLHSSHSSSAHSEEEDGFRKRYEDLWIRVRRNRYDELLMISFIHWKRRFRLVKKLYLFMRDRYLSYLAHTFVAWKQAIGYKRTQVPRVFHFWRLLTLLRTSWKLRCAAYYFRLWRLCFALSRWGARRSTIVFMKRWMQQVRISRIIRAEKVTLALTFSRWKLSAQLIGMFNRRLQKRAMSLWSRSMIRSKLESKYDLFYVEKCKQRVFRQWRSEFYKSKVVFLFRGRHFAQLVQKMFHAWHDDASLSRRQRIRCKRFSLFMKHSLDRIFTRFVWNAWIRALHATRLRRKAFLFRKRSLLARLWSKWKRLAAGCYRVRRVKCHKSFALATERARAAATLRP
eukprot:ANDGO_00985.mRNA.1 hypothetical protein